MQINSINNNLNQYQLNKAVPPVQPGQPKPPPPKTPPEVAAFMAKLGLSPTNSKDGDKAAIDAKLAELEAAAKAGNDKQNVKDLKDELNNIINSIQPPQGPPPPPTDNFIGMEQLAAMNKHFML